MTIVKFHVRENLSFMYRENGLKGFIINNNNIID